MRTIDYIDVLSATADLCGLDRDNLSSNEFKKLRTSHSNRLATAYEWYDWPDLMRAEHRYLRPLYSATIAYVVDDIIFYVAGDAYYKCIQANTGQAPTEAAYWTVVTRADFDPYISPEQTGQTVMGTVLGVFDKDPRRYETLVELDWHPSSNGIQLTDNLTKGWVEFRLRAPDLKGDAWDASGDYAVGDQAYFSDYATPGNFYDCATVTTGGESPITTAAKWTKVQIPYIFGRHLSQAGLADYLTSDQQSERKAQEELFAIELITNQVTLVAGQQGHFRRVSVLTR